MNFQKTIVMKNKGQIILIIFLLIFSSSFSQINDEINKSSNKIDSLSKKIKNDDLVMRYMKYDTIFILFSESKKSKKKLISETKKFSNKKVLDTTIRYGFKLKDCSYVGFVYRRYFDFDKAESDSRSLVLKKNRDFLKFNKNKIISRRELNKKRKTETDYIRSLIDEIVTSKKFAFIIDMSETINNTIVLRQIKPDRLSTSFFNNM